jgi:hypothetical protein
VKEWLDRGNAIPWMGVKESLKRGLPEGSVPEPDQWAHELVPVALDQVYGAQGEGWDAERRAKRDDPTKTTLWVVINAK